MWTGKRVFLIRADKGASVAPAAAAPHEAAETVLLQTYLNI